MRFIGRQTAAWLAVAAAAVLLVWVNVEAMTARQVLEKVWGTAEQLDPSPATIVSNGRALIAAEDDGTLSALQGENRQARLDTAPAALTTDTVSGRVFAADAHGLLSVFGPDLTVIARLQLPGRVSGLAALPDGSVAVCWGMTGYGPDYHVGIVTPPYDRLPDTTHRTGFATQLIAASSGEAYYGTVNARLGKVAKEGALVWERVLEQRPVAIAVTPGGRVAVGDRRGHVAFLDADGTLAGRHGVSVFPVDQVAFHREGTLLVAADRTGTLFLFDQTGQPLGSLPGKASGPVTTFVSHGDGLMILHADGILTTMDLSDSGAVLGAARTLRRLVPANILLVMLLAVSGLCTSADATDRTARTFRQVYAGRVAYALLLPTFCLLAVFCYYPVVTAFLYAFTKFSLSSPVEWVGLDNFRAMLHDKYVWVGVRNMLIFLVTGLVKTLTMPLLAAELMFWLSGERLRQFFRTAFVVPAVVPALVSVLLWKIIYSPDIGLLDKTLEALALGAWKHAWLAKEGLAIWSIVFAGFPWVNVFAFLVLLGGLINISRDIFEAGEIDGLGVFRRFLHIDLPLIRPQLRLLIVFVFIGSIQDFTSVLVFTGGGPGISTYVPALQMFYQTAEGANMGYASAIGVVLFALVLAATVINLNLMKTREN